MSGEISLYLNIILTMLVIGHIFRTNRPKYWIFIILISGILGAVIYFIFEILPELLGRPRAHKIIRQAKYNLNRKANIETLEKRQEFTGSIDATRHLANTLIENGRTEEAVSHYKNILTGIYREDPDLLLGLAEAQFAHTTYEDCITTLDYLREKNPQYTSANGHLIYAMSLEKCNRIEEAFHEYEALTGYFIGAEAKYHFAKLLETELRHEDALIIYQDILTAAEIAPEHYRQAQQEWLSKSKQAIKRLNTLSA